MSALARPPQADAVLRRIAETTGKSLGVSATAPAFARQGPALVDALRTAAGDLAA